MALDTSSYTSKFVTLKTFVPEIRLQFCWKLHVSGRSLPASFGTLLVPRSPVFPSTYILELCSQGCYTWKLGRSLSRVGSFLQRGLGEVGPSREGMESFLQAGGEECSEEI